MKQEQVKAKLQEAAREQEKNQMVAKNTTITVEEEKNMLIGVDLKKQEAVEIKEAEVVKTLPEVAVAGAQSESVPASVEENFAAEEVVTGDENTDVAESESVEVDDSDEHSVIDTVLKEAGIKDKACETQPSGVRSWDEIKGAIRGDFKVIVPDMISKEEPADMFECNKDLREYINNKMGTDVFLKIWSSLNSHGEIFIHLRYKGVGATETVLKQIRRESTLGNKTCLNFLKNYKKMDITIIKALYKVLDALHDKLDEVDNAEVEGLTLYETYSAVINHVEARLLKVSEEEKDNLDIKTHLIEGEQYVCIKGARKLERVLSEVSSPFKKMEFLKQLKYAEEVDKPLLKVADGRAYDNRETGDTDHWYYIRRDKNIMGEA
uniref:hypothetical protein n=1 Tax=Acetatifactor sp. TaxID=1872090 RepID=UPI004055A526